MNMVQHFRSTFSLEGKIALVAGGAGGIGRAISQALTSYGCRVLLTGRTKEKADVAALALYLCTPASDFVS